MEREKVQISQLISVRNVMLQAEKERYIKTIEKINIRTAELLEDDFGTVLVRNTAHDLAGEVARRYFDLGDYYITVDQLYERFVHFSYDSDVDILSSDEEIRKAFYNMNDSNSSKTIRNITASSEAAKQKLFVENRASDAGDKKGKIEYRRQKTTKDGKIYDELTGQEGSTTTITQNGKEILKSDLHADHIQVRETVMYDTRYLRSDKVDAMKAFYNSADNMQMMHASANTSKGDVRVCTINGKIEYLNSKEMKSRQDKGERLIDITSKATVEQLAEATITQWEKQTSSGDKLKILKEKGYLDENGKVKPGVKKELEDNIRHSQNKESVQILKNTDYKSVTKDAVKETKKSIGNIIAGQVIYYVMPPMIFETQTIVRKKDMTLDKFFSELKGAGKRVVKYVVSKLGEIFKNIIGNSISKFIKTFFDIIIEMVKATVKKLMKMLKELIMSLVNCGKILIDKKASAAQKADSITKILAVSVTGIVMELLFEYLEKQFGLPDFLMEPLQIITTILATNIIMLVLQKADLFNIKYGLMVSNIEQIFDEENEKFMKESEKSFEDNSEFLKQKMREIEKQIASIKEDIAVFDIYEDDAIPILEGLNYLFNMDIDFNKEWAEFIQTS